MYACNAPTPGKPWYPGDGGKLARWMSSTCTWTNLTDRRMNAYRDMREAAGYDGGRRACLPERSHARGSTPGHQARARTEFKSSTSILCNLTSRSGFGDTYPVNKFTWIWTRIGTKLNHVIWEFPFLDHKKQVKHRQKIFGYDEWRSRFYWAGHNFFVRVQITILGNWINNK